uniref:NADH-ubiquinone oxidoreductase chain 2 n=1 Tax=Dermophis mexicanus TaxID=118251 RepID=C9D8A8_DERME|nr:NADH dehydrogenase subunit 2 [Dermophis mexicanus]ACS37041.1 NADH dehydrogenase subunit 2 [Dermophis mexicanus]AGZ18931.1 NADH dehydrogenase subunit 2 [Dermophis mexicanus]
MTPFTLLIVLFSLMMGTTLTVTSSHWLLAWMGLEINTLAIIPMMIKHHHPRATEATTKYFLTQATASALILFSTMMNAWTTGEWEMKEMTPMTSNMLTIALLMKLGLAPMHFWMPEVLQGLDLLTGLIMSTWQKIAPISIIFMLHNLLNPLLLTILGLMSILIGGWTGLNQTQLRKIMAYSSIAHLGWMVIILPFSPTLMMLNFMLYMIMTSTMFLTLKMLNSTKINTLTMMWTKMPILAAMTAITLLSLGGLPPTTGFMPKWLILQELTNQHNSTMATIIAISAMLSLFFYLRLSYSIILTQSPNIINSTITWRQKPYQMITPLALTIIMTIYMLPLTPNILSL